ncbi:MAG TPA: iron-containing alcohol dehydrogenase, partial [Polyangiaceae bacterium]|nr:iron-containing alcohol dehydrogenase [Polyangiaceae bacterium]
MRGAQRPLIITDRGVRDARLIEIAQAAFESGGVDAKLVFDDVPQDSSTEAVADIARLYRARDCDALIAIGGGSVIDTAKAANILVSEGGEDLRVYAGTNVLKRRLKPLFVL